MQIKISQIACQLFLTLLIGAIGLFPLNGQPDIQYATDLDLKSYISDLSKAPKEGSRTEKSQNGEIMIPMPDGDLMAFNAEEVNLMSPEFKALHPEILTYRIVAVNNRDFAGRLTISPTGMIATIFTNNGVIEISPVNPKSSNPHKSVLLPMREMDFSCAFDEVQAKEITKHSRQLKFSNGSVRRTYKLAIVTTGYYGATHGVNANTAITAIVGALEDIYEKELAVKFILLPPQIFSNFMTDPFNDNNSERAIQAAEAIAANWTDPATYDIGHVFHSTGGHPDWGGGIAYFGLCDDSILDGSTTGRTKAGAWSSLGTSQTGALGLLAHEVGHQFYMAHSFNGTGGSCTNNISLDHAYEIGSGTTIMSYNGICGAGQNIPSEGAIDNYFHGNSLDQAIARMNATSCPATIASGNTAPVVNANTCGGSYTIPVGTPFKLCGSGTDADNDQIFYTWEQMNEDGAGVKPTQGFIGAAAAASNIAPLFRSYPPSSSPDRCFPNMNLIVANNYASDFEPLPTVARTLNFRLTGRDMKTVGGGVHSSDIAVAVSNLGPFVLTAPNGGGAPVAAGSMINVTWNLNGINFLNNVSIKLSIDGGLNYPYVLKTSTPAADGMEMVTIPNNVPGVMTARIMVQSADNTCVKFFDISNSNFEITSNCGASFSRICPVTTVTLPFGDPGLNLALTNNFGTPVTQHLFTVNTGNPLGPVANATVAGGSVCQVLWPNNEYYSTFDFYVETTGSYTFSEGTFSFAFSVFQAAGYNPATPCAGIFIGSNSTGAINFSEPTTLTLTACTRYKLVVWTLNGASHSQPITFSGGTIYTIGAGPAGSYSYTYVAVNKSTGQIAAVSTAANFTALGAGNYTIYGASYYSGAGPTPPAVTPGNWVNLTLPQVYSGGDCVVFSTNSKLMTITGSCQTIEAVNGTIATGVYQASTQITSSGTIPSPNVVTFRAGNNVELQNNFNAQTGSILNVIMGPCI